MKRLILLAVLFVSTSSAWAGGAHFGKQVRYVGIHPIPKGNGGGICYIEVPHVHIYAPNKIEYRVHDDDNYFVGDPVAYGWDGPKVKYKGPHPIQVDIMVGGQPDTEFCYLEGPHFHYFEPPDDDGYKVAGDAYFYVNEPPKVFVEARPQYTPINAYYRPMVYERPVVDVTPPEGWIGLRAEFVPAAVVVVPPPPVVVAEPGIAVGVGAEVHIPMPSVHLGVQIGGPAVIIDERGRGHGKHKKFKRH
jgi:hypothetical protein